MPDADKSLYEVSKWEIFSKNFLVGFSRAFGALVMQVIGLGVFYFLFVQFVAPSLGPILSTFEEAVDQLKVFQQDTDSQSRENIVIPYDLLQQLNNSTTAPTTR